MSWLGADIGGANLKVADSSGWARSVAFALWQRPEQLAESLAALFASAPSCERIAVTMTGELCDCFRTKHEGVLHILRALERASGERDVAVYLVDGRFVPLAEARSHTELAAASNWHATARLACELVEARNALLVDIGSTTSDIVPLVEGIPRAQGLNDTARLLAGELLYFGVDRTPLCSIVSELPWRGRLCPVAAELFATTADAYLSLSLVPEEPACTNTADGRPRTREFARERMARMICTDAQSFSDEDARAAAQHVCDAQIAKLRSALVKATSEMDGAPTQVVTAGAGEFLAVLACRELWPEASLISLADRIGKLASQCAPAYALALLANRLLDSRNATTEQKH